MNAATVLQQFDHLAAAPNGIAKLRELVLQLAVQGRLLPDTATHFSSRDDWQESTLDQIGQWAIGSGFPKREQGRSDAPIPFCKVSDMNRQGNELEILSTANTIDEATARRLRAKIHPPGTVIFPKIGGAIATNKRRILVRPTAIDNNCLGIVPSMACSTDWLFVFLRSIDLMKYQSGTSVPALSQRVIGSIRILVPPLPEQKRIVAKVDELMALCDDLEAKQQGVRTKQIALNRASLQALTEPNGGSLTAAWHRVRDHFDHLYTVPDTVAELRQTILQLAVMGRLIPQDPNDGPASELLKKIQAEKQRLIAEGKIRKSKAVPEIEDEELPFAIPAGWMWQRLQAISLDVHYGYTASADATVTDTKLLRITDIQNDSVDWESVPGCRIEDSEIGKYALQEGDVVIARTGGTIGKSYLVDSPPERALFASYLIRVIPAMPSEPRFLKLFLGSPLYWDQLREGSKGTGQPNVNATSLKGLALPLPPLAEQKRIVAKVDQLMALCNDLETRLQQTQADADNLLVAIVHELVGSPRGEQE